MMLCFDVGNNRFHFRAGAVFIHEGFVLLNQLDGDPFWFIPGGRVDIHEDASSTLKREMIEELGERVEVGNLSLVVENFFCDRGKQQHELGLYFLASFEPSSQLLDKQKTHLGIETDTALRYRWFNLSELAQVDLRPAFLREALATPSPTVRHFVQRD